MNFLSHSFVLPPDSAALTRVGSALPDLWPLVSPRPLPAVVLRVLDANQDPRCGELRRGIAHHMQSDSVFHGHPEFESRVDWLARQLRAHWPDLHHASTYAHVLVEMLLDRWLIETDPAPLETYYQAFSPENLGFAAQHAVSESEVSPALLAVLERFAGLQFLRGYTNAEGLAMRFLGLTRRLPWPWEWLPSLQEELIDNIDPWHKRMRPRSGELLEAVRAGVEARAKNTAVFR
jgi:hypothetical protein